MGERSFDGEVVSEESISCGDIRVCQGEKAGFLEYYAECEGWYTAKLSLLLLFVAVFWMCDSFDLLKVPAS